MVITSGVVKLNNSNGFLVFLFALFSALSFQSLSANDLQTYIVHVKLPHQLQSSNFVGDLDDWYRTFLPESLSMSPDSVQPSSRLVYSYRHVVTGFAARLTPEEVKAMEKKEGFLMASPERKLSSHTTRSPYFLGLQQNYGFWKDSNFGEGVIIGVLDSGVTPNHLSFNDDGMSPPSPAKWNRTTCQLIGFKCNNKIIGIRNFIAEETEIDNDGHGTHTASTAGGNFVNGAKVFGNANGIAVGIAPRAHLAIYKVLDKDGNGDSGSILAAMDAAVGDGVDVLSLSLGGGSDTFFADGVAIGAFGAMKKGVFVSCSAGNSGPSSQTLENEAPWILTVGASSIDRSIRATAKLGNNMEFNGESLNQSKTLDEKMLPLIFPGINGDLSTACCLPGALDKIDIRGKIVLCQESWDPAVTRGQTVLDGGGAAMISMNWESEGYSISAEAHVLPAIQVSHAAGLEIIKYISSTQNPTATILFKGTVIESDDAPMVASFSSRGPSKPSPGILKPDIIGPGVNILAAWPLSVDGQSKPTSAFNIISGTSMSCPHLSGVVALLKNKHPDWSPAAIKSAIMTTAYQRNLKNESIVDEGLFTAGLFAVGAGHVNPSKAVDPGLVYDIQPEDYIPYLCGLGYPDKQVNAITRESVECSTISKIDEAQLNYPSFAITLGSTGQRYTRTVTNVGEAISSYDLEIGSTIPGIKIIVIPRRLHFYRVYEKLSYQVIFTRSQSADDAKNFLVQTSLSWVSTTHTVRIPIAIRLANLAHGPVETAAFSM